MVFSQGLPWPLSIQHLTAQSSQGLKTCLDDFLGGVPWIWRHIQYRQIMANHDHPQITRRLDQKCEIAFLTEEVDDLITFSSTWMNLHCDMLCTMSLSILILLERSRSPKQPSFFGAWGGISLSSVWFWCYPPSSLRLIPGKSFPDGWSPHRCEGICL